MNRVKRAVILAAGLGKRMRPVTWTTPKPLVPVRGTPMIESCIQALHRAGIAEIHVVVGYLREQFLYLPQTYPGLSLVENPDYRTANNISSLYVARDFLEDAVILDGDQLILDDAVLNPVFARSGYCCHWTDGPTEEWLLTVKDGVVTACSRTGGMGGYQLYSVSFWSAADGARLREQVELEYVQRGNRDLYWDDIALFCHPRDYALGIREISPGSILEIDALDELAALDPAYARKGGPHEAE